MRPDAFLVCLALAGAAAAEAPTPQRMVTEAESPAYAAVGRLNVAGNRHCTATLIDASHVLTAAHCLYNPRTGRRAEPADLRFVAGQRRDVYAALRGVSAIATPPDYVYDPRPSLDVIGADLALLALDAPVTEAAPIPAGDWIGATSVSIVGYGRDRSQIASIREGCTHLGRQGEVAVLDCTVTFGVSGAPVLEAHPDGLRVVAVVSAMGESSAGPVALVAPTAARLDALRSVLGPD